MYQHIGRYLVFFGIAIAVVGAVMVLLGRAGLFSLPGDFEFGSKNWRVYFPVASCILISVILTAVLWLINWLRR